MDPSDLFERVPIHTDADGVVRVTRTRVTLDTIAAAFEDGATAEAIALQYPSNSLADVYAVIAYSLRHKHEVDAYRAEREQRAGRVLAEVERRHPPSIGIRERLLVRRRDGAHR